MTETLSPIVSGIRAPGIGLPKLIGDIGEILHHPTLTFPHFPPFPLFFLSTLERGRRAIECVDSASRLSGSTRFAAVGVDILRVHLCGSGKAGKRERKSTEYRCSKVCEW